MAVLIRWRMGLADRDYIRNDAPRASSSRLTSVVKWLLAINAGVFVLDYVILSQVFGMEQGDPPILRWGAFSIRSSILEFNLWQFVTFQFIHGSMAHVGFNCIAICIFGPWMERWAGSRRFLLFYLICGCGGAALFSLLSWMKVVPGSVDSCLVGASAGIFGILVGVAMCAPGLRVTLLFPPVTLTMRQLALAMLGCAVIMIVFGIGGNEGGEAGHLGGALVGYLLMRLPLLWDTGIKETRRDDAPLARTSKLRPRSELRLSDDPEVDAILEKISADGFQSLTEMEKRILDQASKRQNSIRP